MSAAVLELPEIPANDAGDASAGAAAIDAALAAHDDDDRESSAAAPGAIGTPGEGEAVQPAPQTPTGKPGTRDRATAPAPGAAAPGAASDTPKKLSKRALGSMSKRQLVQVIVDQQAAAEQTAARVASLEEKATVVAALPPDHSLKLAKETVLTAAGLVVVATQDGRYMLNPDQVTRLAEAWSGVVAQLPAVVSASPWSRALMATGGVLTEKFIELKRTPAPPAAPSPA